MKKIFNNQSGFTLLEIMVTLAIVGVVTMLAIPSFRGLQQRMRIKAAGREITMDLLLARAKAVARGEPQTVTFNAADGACPGNSGSWQVQGEEKKCLSRDYNGVSFTHSGGDPFLLKDEAGDDTEVVEFTNRSSLTNNLSTLSDIGTIYLGNPQGNQMRITVRQFTGLAKLYDSW